MQQCRPAQKSKITRRLFFLSFFQGGGHYTVLWTQDTDIMQLSPPAIPTVPLPPSGLPLRTSPVPFGSGRSGRSGRLSAAVAQACVEASQPTLSTAESAASVLQALRTSGLAGSGGEAAQPELGAGAAVSAYGDDEDADLQRALALSILESSQSTQEQDQETAEGLTAAGGAMGVTAAQISAAAAEAAASAAAVQQPQSPRAMSGATTTTSAAAHGAGRTAAPGTGSEYRGDRTAAFQPSHAESATAKASDECNNGNTSDEELALALSLSMQAEAAAGVTGGVGGAATGVTTGAASGTDSSEPGAKRWRDGAGEARSAAPQPANVNAMDEDAELQRALEESVNTFQQVRPTLLDRARRWGW